eukprot:4801778-Heterocapsa_arctica.AAC.1
MSSRYSAHRGDTSRILTGTVPGGGRATASQFAGKDSPRRGSSASSFSSSSLRVASWKVPA